MLLSGTCNILCTCTISIHTRILLSNKDLSDEEKEALTLLSNSYMGTVLIALVSNIVRMKLADSIIVYMKRALGWPGAVAAIALVRFKLFTLCNALRAPSCAGARQRDAVDI